MDQPILIDQVASFVRQFLPTFTNEEIVYVRSMRSPKMGIFNVQCRSVTIATLVKNVAQGAVVRM